MWNMGTVEIVVIVLAIIVLFGAKKLPEIGSSLGKAIREFKKVGKEIKHEVNDTIEEKGEEKNNG